MTTPIEVTSDYFKTSMYEQISLFLLRDLIWLVEMNTLEYWEVIIDIVYSSIGFNKRCEHSIRQKVCLTIHEVFVIKGFEGIQIANDGKSPSSYVLVTNGNT